MTQAVRIRAQAARLPGLTVLVALVHGWLLTALGDPAAPVPRAAQGRAVMTLVRAQPLPVAAQPRLPEAAARPRLPEAAAQPRLPEAAAQPPRADAIALAPVPVPRAAAGSRWPAASAVEVAAATAAAESADAPPPSPAGDGEPPPVYATRVPPPVALRFAARINGVDGAAELQWQHDGERYRLALRVQGPAPPLLEQRSEGGFDAAGLAPDRFVDRRRGRTVGAAHFRRDIGRISFSGPSIDYPAWAGAQDRLAWLPQLVAVLAAAADPPDELRFFVADARGVARAWIFRAQGSETVESASGPVRALKLLREPPRSDDLRVTVWLDPAQGWWPVRLEQAVPISGALFELTRAEFAPAEPAPDRVGP